MSEIWEIFIDGACSGNPGEAGIGIVINHEGKTIKEISKVIGEAVSGGSDGSLLKTHHRLVDESTD